MNEGNYVLKFIFWFFMFCKRILRICFKEWKLVFVYKLIYVFLFEKMLVKINDIGICG